MLANPMQCRLNELSLTLIDLSKNMLQNQMSSGASSTRVGSACPVAIQSGGLVEELKKFGQIPAHHSSDNRRTDVDRHPESSDEHPFAPYGRCAYHGAMVVRFLIMCFTGDRACKACNP